MMIQRKVVEDIVEELIDIVVAIALNKLIR